MFSGTGVWTIAVAFVAINAAFRLYHGNVLYPAAPVSPVQEFRRLAESSAITHIGVIAYLALAYQTTENYSRAVIVISGILVAVLSQTVRDVFRRVAFKAGVAQIPVVVAGSGPQAERVRNALARDAYTGFKVVRTFSGDLHGIVPESRRLKVRILVACQEDHPVAALLLETGGETFVDDLPCTMHVSSTFCHPDHRGTGVMSALAAFASDRMHASGIPFLGVDCETLNPPAFRFWQKHFTPFTLSAVRRLDERLHP